MGSTSAHKSATTRSLAKSSPHTDAAFLLEMLPIRKSSCEFSCTGVRSSSNPSISCPIETSVAATLWACGAMGEEGYPLSLLPWSLYSHLICFLFACSLSMLWGLWRSFRSVGVIRLKGRFVVLDG